MRCALTSAMAAATAPSSVSSTASGAGARGGGARVAAGARGGGGRLCDRSVCRGLSRGLAVAAVPGCELEEPLQAGMAGDQIG